MEVDLLEVVFVLELVWDCCNEIVEIESFGGSGFVFLEVGEGEVYVEIVFFEGVQNYGGLYFVLFDVVLVVFVVVGLQRSELVVLMLFECLEVGEGIGCLCVVVWVTVLDVDGFLGDVEIVVMDGILVVVVVGVCFEEVFFFIWCCVVEECLGGWFYDFDWEIGLMFEVGDVVGCWFVFVDEGGVVEQFLVELEFWGGGDVL